MIHFSSSLYRPALTVCGLIILIVVRPTLSQEKPIFQAKEKSQKLFRFQLLNICCLSQQFIDFGQRVNVGHARSGGAWSHTVTVVWSVKERKRT